METIQERRKVLYLAYLAELDTFRMTPRPESHEVQQQWFYDYSDNKDCQWHDIYVNDCLVGFLITSSILPNCHPDADYSICEAYVMPEYRQKGLMSNLVQRFTSEHPGIYCLLVLEGNQYAQHFWNHLFHHLGATDVVLTDSAIITNGEQVCLQGFHL